MEDLCSSYMRNGTLPVGKSRLTWPQLQASLYMLNLVIKTTQLGIDIRTFHWPFEIYCRTWGYKCVMISRCRYTQLIFIYIYIFTYIYICIYIHHNVPYYCIMCHAWKSSDKRCLLHGTHRALQGAPPASGCHGASWSQSAGPATWCWDDQSLLQSLIMDSNITVIDTLW